jgi:hypothetical protein
MGEHKAKQGGQGGRKTLDFQRQRMRQLPRTTR